MSEEYLDSITDDYLYSVWQPCECIECGKKWKIDISGFDKEDLYEAINRRDFDLCDNPTCNKKASIRRSIKYIENKTKDPNVYYRWKEKIQPQLLDLRKELQELEQND